MKVLGIVSVLLIIVSSLGMLVAGCVEQPVVFSDKHIEVRIRILMKNPAGAIYTSDLEKLTSLYVGGVNITSLSGLEYCTNLIELNLVGNQISDISPLSSLTSLTHLNLSSNQISDISPLSSLAGLTNLSLSVNQISDVSPLSSLACLTNLSLSNNQISDVSPLSSLTNLTELSLFKNQISDVSPLSSLTNLAHLDLRWNQVCDVSPLSSLTNLSELWLSFNPIILPLPPLPGEGEEALPPIEPPPPGGYPGMDSALSQLVVAEIRGEAASFAKPRNIKLINGSVKVIIEVMPGQMEAATEAATKVGARIGSSYKNLISAIVPIRNLAVLAAEESISLVRMPLTPVPAVPAVAPPPPPPEPSLKPPLPGEGEGALPPIEPPPPEKGYPGMDSALSQLVVAEIRGEAASYAKSHGIELINGSVKVIIEAMPGELEAATEAATKAGAKIWLSYKNLLQATVPIMKLPALAAEESIRFIERPESPVPAASGAAPPPAPPPSPYLVPN